MYKIKRFSSLELKNFGLVKAMNKIAKKAWESKGAEKIASKLGKTVKDDMPKFNLPQKSGGTSLSRFRKINVAQSNAGGLNQAITRKGNFEKNVLNNMSDKAKNTFDITKNAKSSIMKNIDARGHRPDNVSELLK